MSIYVQHRLKQNKIILRTGLPEPIKPVDKLSHRFSVVPVSSHFHCEERRRLV